MLKATWKVDTNLTFKRENDDFEDVFENIYVNLLIFGIYMLGILGCFGLVLVSYFERSGQAGPFRTLLNQIVTFTSEQLLIYYLVGTSIDNLRIFLGPLPTFLCNFGTFAKTFSGMNMGILTMTSTMAKFVFVIWYKNPRLEDNFVGMFIFVISNLVAFFSTFSKWYLEAKSSGSEVKSVF